MKIINKVEEIKEKRDSQKVFSRIESIELYHALDNETPGTLVLEGGAFRGIYTAGVLDCLMDHDINITNAIGISAGGLIGSNYIAGCRGRAAVGMLKNRFNPRYVGLRAYKESGSIVGFKVLFDDFDKILALNEEQLFSKNRELYVGCTNTLTGEIEYFSTHDGKDTFYKALIAGASMPLVSKMVKIKDGKYLDGGCNTKIPLDFALKNKMKKIVVVTTRPIEHRRKEIPNEYHLEEVRYKNYPKFLEAIKKSGKKYNEDAEKIEKLAAEGKIFLIQPSKPVTISRLESNMEKLGELYELGYNDALYKIDDLMEYLEIDHSVFRKAEKRILGVFSLVKNFFSKVKKV